MYIDTEKAILVTSHGKVNQEKGYWHKGNTLKNHLLIIFTDGSLTMQIDNKKYDVCCGDALLIPRHTSYRPLQSTGCEYYFFHFSSPEATAKNAEIKIGTNPNLPDGNYAFSYTFDVSPVIEVKTLTKNFDLRIQNVLDRVSKINVWQRVTEKLLLDSYTREILTLLGTNTSQNQIIDPTLRKIIRYIDNDFKNHITLSTLSDMFGISQSYIARLFKTTLNTCSADYINGVRLRYSCDLLLNSSLSIGEISERVGFNNQYYFTRVFKAYLKMTPSEFRKQKQSIT